MCRGSAIRSSGGRNRGAICIWRGCVIWPALRTLPPFAHTAIADAETPRRRSTLFIASQKTSRLRSSIGVKLSQFQTAFSLQLGPTIGERTNRICALAAIAGAAFDCSCGALLAALQPMSPDRSFSGSDFFRQNDRTFAATQSDFQRKRILKTSKRTT